MSRGLILAIETSCDETAAAVVQRGAHTLSSVVASQIATHARYGGVVPELASREHLRAIVPVVRAALAQAGLTLADLDAIAVTGGPGLAGALLVGITYAKALAFAVNLPLIAVNHLEGHIHAVLLNEREQRQALKGTGFSPYVEPQALKGMGFSPYVEPQALKGTGFSPYVEPQALKGTGFSPYVEPPKETGALAPEGILQTGTPGAPSFPRSPAERAGEPPASPPHHPADDPALALVVSGGHTHLYLAHPTAGTWQYTLIGRTLDDAAGEAYDKVAKLLGLGYPGGPWIDALAQFGNPHAVPFAFSQIKTKLHLAGKAPRTKAAKTAPIASLDRHFLFSFSGIKTAVLRYVELHNLRPEAESRHEILFPSSHTPGAPSIPRSSAEWVGKYESSPAPKPPTTHSEALALCSQPTLDLIASFQHAVVGDLLKKTFAAAESLAATRVLVTGGVAANRELRARFTAEAARRNLSVSFPTLALSTDNAAMIAAAAWPRFLTRDFAPPSLSADPSLALGR